jgi:predicted dinucleotide-binding enzyme
MGQLGMATAALLAGRCELVLGTARSSQMRDFAASLPGGVLASDYRTAGRFADICVLCVPAAMFRAVIASLPGRAGRIILLPWETGQTDLARGLPDQIGSCPSKFKPQPLL